MPIPTLIRIHDTGVSALRTLRGCGGRYYRAYKQTANLLIKQVLRTFCYGFESADPYLWLTDPDPGCSKSYVSRSQCITTAHSANFMLFINCFCVSMVLSNPGLLPCVYWQSGALIIWQDSCVALFYRKAQNLSDQIHNLRGGRWSSAEYSAKKNPPKKYMKTKKSHQTTWLTLVKIKSCFLFSSYSLL